MATINDGETLTVAGGSTRLFTDGLQVSGTLEAQGRVVVTDSGAEMLGKSRSEGRRQLVTRADGVLD